jgi:hypothetical protein
MVVKVTLRDPWLKKQQLVVQAPMRGMHFRALTRMQSMGMRLKVGTPQEASRKGVKGCSARRGA